MSIRGDTISSKIQYIVLRLRRVRNPEVVAIEHLERFLRQAQKDGVTVLLAGVRPNLAKVLRNLSFDKWLPADWIYPEHEEVHSFTRST